MFFFGGEKPVRKREIKSVIAKTQFAWVIVAITLPLLGIFTLYLFKTYTTYQGEFYAPVIIVLQIIYSSYLIWTVFTEGIKLDSAKMKKLKENQYVYISRIINRKQLNRYYTGIFLYFLLMIFIIFSTL
jgi:hypothetical protein